MNYDYADICGVSEAELHRYFDEEIYELGKTYGLSKSLFYEIIAEKYGQYHFCKESSDIYNPGNILRCLLKKSFFESNACSFDFTATTIKDLCDKIIQDDGVTINCIALRDSRDLGDYPISLLYRTGILSIKEYDKKYDIFHLGFPNNEIAYQISSKLKSIS